MPFRDGQKCSCEKEWSGLRSRWQLRLVCGTQAPGDDSTEFYLRASMDDWGCEGRVYENFLVPTDLCWAQHIGLFANGGAREAKAPKEWARALLLCCQNAMDFSIAVINDQEATWGEKGLFGLFTLSHKQTIVHRWRKARQEPWGRNSETAEEHCWLVCYSRLPQFTSQDRLPTDRTAPKCWPPPHQSSVKKMTRSLA